MGLASKLNKQAGSGAPSVTVPPQMGLQGSYHPPSFSTPSQDTVQMGKPPQGSLMYHETQSGRPFGGDLPPPNYNQSQPSSMKQHMPMNSVAGSQPTSAGIVSSLRKCVSDNRLEAFYPEHKLQQIAAHCSTLQPKVNSLCAEWGVPQEMAYDFYKLALYDIIMLCDDSGSMMFEEHGERVRDLEVIISYVAKAAALFDTDGISVRFLNSSVSEDGITDAAQVRQLINKVSFSGLTPLGTVLESKIVQPFFFNEMKNNTLTKPLLVIIITDGCPAGEPRGHFESVLSNVYRTSNGGVGISFAVAQVGTDQHAQRFLAELDTHREFGKMIDVTSNFELEQEEMRRKAVNLTPQLWICKLIMGAIDPSYDEIDE